MRCAVCRKEIPKDLQAIFIGWNIAVCQDCNDQAVAKQKGELIPELLAIIERTDKEILNHLQSVKTLMNKKKKVLEKVERISNW